MLLCTSTILDHVMSSFSALAHEHSIDNPDSRFLDTLERPDNAANPSRDVRSRLCCTDKDAVKVDYELVLPAGPTFVFETCHDIFRRSPI